MVNARAKLASDAQPEREPAGRELGDGQDLPGHQQRVAQHHQVDGQVHAEVVGGGDDGGGVGQSVVADPVVEHHVVADHHVVDARLAHPAQHARAVGHRGRADLDGLLDPGLGHQVDPEADGVRRHRSVLAQGVAVGEERVSAFHDLGVAHDRVAVEAFQAQLVVQGPADDLEDRLLG
jgi:hypothetical protein